MLVRKDEERWMPAIDMLLQMFGMKKKYAHEFVNKIENEFFTVELGDTLKKKLGLSLDSYQILVNLLERRFYDVRWQQPCTVFRLDTR